MAVCVGCDFFIVIDLLVILTCYCNVYDVFLLKILKPYGEEEKGR
jgi:hypothetical protein